MTFSRLKWYILFLAVIFGVTVVLGYVFALRNPLPAAEIVEDVAKELGVADGRPSILEMFGFILLNNAGKALVMVLLGTFFGVIPLIFIGINGYLLGVVLSVAGERIGSVAALMGILPHGLLEIPAILMAGSAGSWLGLKLFQKIFYRHPFLPALRLALGWYFRFILPLIFIAAIIEAFVTPAVIYLFV